MSYLAPGTIVICDENVFAWVHRHDADAAVLETDEGFITGAEVTFRKVTREDMTAVISSVDFSMVVGFHFGEDKNPLRYLQLLPLLALSEKKIFRLLGVLQSDKKLEDYVRDNFPSFYNAALPEGDRACNFTICKFISKAKKVCRNETK